MGFELIFVVWSVREPGGVAVNRRKAWHGDPHYRSNTRPLIRSEQLIRRPRVASLASASSFKRPCVSQWRLPFFPYACFVSQIGKHDDFRAVLRWNDRRELKF